MKLIRKGASSSSSSSVPHSSKRHASFSKDIYPNSEQEKTIGFQFNCCRRSSVVENNHVERVGLGTNGEEFAMISVCPKQQQPQQQQQHKEPSSVKDLDDINTIMSHEYDSFKIVNDTTTTTTTTSSMEGEKPLTQQKSVLPFRKVKSIAVVSTPRNQQTKTLEHTVPLQRQGFSLISFRRNRVPKQDENVEKVYSDVGSEYALIKVVSKLDQQHRK